MEIQTSVIRNLAEDVSEQMDKEVRGAAPIGMTSVLLNRHGRARRGRHQLDHVVRRLSELPAILSDSSFTVSRKRSRSIATSVTVVAACN